MTRHRLTDVDILSTLHAFSPQELDGVDLPSRIQVVNGLQVLSPATMGQLLAAGLNICSTAAVPHQFNTSQPDARTTAVAADSLAAGQDSSSEEAGMTWALDLHLLKVLCELPAAQQLPVDSIQQLLPAAPAALCQEQSALACLMHHSCGSSPADKLQDRLDYHRRGSTCRNTGACVELLQQLLMLPAAEQVATAGQWQYQWLKHVIWGAKAVAAGATVRISEVCSCIISGIARLLVSGDSTVWLTTLQQDIPYDLLVMLKLLENYDMLLNRVIQ
jgi:hypothetical protein